MSTYIRDKKTGRMGILTDPNAFNPQEHEIVQDQKPKSSSAGKDLLMSIINPIKDAGVNTYNRIGGAGYELNRSKNMAAADLMSKLGMTNLADKNLQQASNTNPFLKTEEDIATATDPMQIAKDSANILSLAVPAGKANVFGKTVAPSLMKSSAISGLLGGFGASDSEDIAGAGVDALTGGATGIVGGKVLGKLLGGKGSKAVGDTGQELVTDILQEGTRKATKKPGVLPTTIFNNQFIIPTRSNRMINPKKVSEKMVEYGVSGSFDDMTRVADTVTGKDGMLSKVVRDSIAGIDTGIDVSQALKSATTIAGKKAALDDNVVNKALRIIRDTIPVGGVDTKSNALDVMDAVRELERLGHAEAAKTASGGIPNPVADDLADIYLGVAEELEDGIGKAMNKTKLIEQFKTPEIFEELNAISPKLAKEFQEATTIEDLRRLQSPFVKLKNMIKLTDQQSTSSFGRVAQGMTGKLANLPIANHIPVLNDALAVADDTVAQRARSYAGAKMGSKMEGLGDNLIANSPAKILSRGASKASNAIPDPLKSLLVGNIAPRAMVGGMSAGEVQAGVPDTPSTPTPDTSGQDPNAWWNQNPAQQSQQGMTELDTVIMKLMLADPKNADMYKSLSPTLSMQGDSASSNVGKVGADKYTQASTGANALAGIKSLVYDADGSIDRSKIAQLSIPGKPGARQLDTLLYQAVDNYLRIQSGAAVPPEEIRKAMEAFKPGVTDSVETVNTKLASLGQVFDSITSLANQKSAPSSEDALYSLLGM